MKAINLKSILFLPLLILFLFTSCQNEESDIINPNNDTTIVANSPLANFIHSTTTYDGSYDNILDYANCLSVNLPVTITVNGITITIESVEDYDELEDLIDAFDNDNDDIEIQFPITITLSNYEQIVINNYDELNDFIEDCFGENEHDDDIECIDFQYPFSISIYDANFQVIDTIEINNDEELYNFISGLEAGVLASINFPINMVLSDGTVIEVSSNQELQAAIEDADDTCDEDDDNDHNDDDCHEEDVELALKECIWNIVSYNGDDIFVTYDLDFDPNYGFTVTDGNGNVLHDGSWSVFVDGNHLYVGLETSWEDLNGNWEVEDCDDHRFELENETTDSTMVIEQDCENNTNPFECYSNTEMVVCDETEPFHDLFTEFDLNMIYPNCNTDNVETHYYVTMADAETQSNPLSSPYTNVSNPQTIYARVQLSGTNTFEIFTVDLVVEDCSNTCTEAQVDAYLLECIWNVVNYNGSNDLIVYDFDFDNNGTVIISGNGQTITAMWSTSQTNDGVWVEFDGVNGANIQAITGNWLIVDCLENRLEMERENDIMVLERDCTNNYTVEDLENVVIEGQWLVANYIDSGINETPDYANWILDFDVNGTVTATNNTTINGTWSAFISSNGQLKMTLDFGTLVPFNEFNDDWDVFDLLVDRLELRDLSGGNGTTDILVFEKI